MPNQDVRKENHIYITLKKSNLLNHLYTTPLLNGTKKKMKQAIIKNNLPTDIEVLHRKKKLMYIRLTVKKESMVNQKINRKK